MRRTHLLRARSAHALAIIVLAATATFAATHTAVRDASADATASVSATRTPVPADLFVTRSRLTSALAAGRPTKERRIVSDALLLAAVLVGALSVSRRRADFALRHQVSVRAFFARRRAPPALHLAR